MLLVDDVTPYELMKLRLLNASHQCLCYFAYLCGYRLVHDAAGDPLFAEFLLAYMDSEATPTLLPVPGIDLPDYKRTLIERFANPGVRDTVARLCSDSSDRIPKWLLPGDPRRTWPPTGRSGCRRRRWPAGPATPRASTSRASRSRCWISWPTRSFRSPARNSENPTAFIENTAVFGDLASSARFVEAYLLGAGFAAPQRRKRDTGDVDARGRRMSENARWSSVRR